MKTHCTPPLHIYITHRMFGSTGPGANKSVEIVGPVYLYSVLLLSGPAVSVCMFLYMVYEDTNVYNDMGITT